VSTFWHEASFAARVLVVAGLTVLVSAAYGARLRLLPVWAIARAGVQLSVVALLLRGALGAPMTAGAFLLLMVTTASLTSVGRNRELWRGRVASVLGVTSGASVSLLVVFGLHLVELEARYVVAVGGIVIGNAMTAATLSGRNFLRAARTRASEVEAWLSLGATPSQAHGDLAREAVHESLIPNLDQTKSTGLVTLPGAFVGALFGGASPLQAAHFQLVVLAGVALAMVSTAVVTTSVLRRSPYVSATAA
jgi:putative ABC transport system permease protein